jgi:hypothetical protein
MAAGAGPNLPPAFDGVPHSQHDVVLARGFEHRGRELLGSAAVEDPANSRLFVPGITSEMELARKLKHEATLASRRLLQLSRRNGPNSAAELQQSWVGSTEVLRAHNNAGLVLVVGSCRKPG